MVREFFAYQRKHPPVHLLVAAFLDYKSDAVDDGAEPRLTTPEEKAQIDQIHAELAGLDLASLQRNA